LADLSDAQGSAFTPSRGAFTPLVSLLLTDFEQIAGMRPAVVAVCVSADPAPFTIPIGDGCRFAQHKLGYLLCPYSWLDQNRCDRCAGYCCGHDSIAITGSFRVLPWMSIPGRV
jgi:hypothetical protein